MIILGIETSCDETAVALVAMKNGKPIILSNIVSSQSAIHSDWGGVVPNLAAREHLKNIIPILDRAIKKSGLTPQDIDLIATTQGPGLIPALLIGNNAAKTLSWTWEKPLLGIHHIEGHIYSNFVRELKNRKSSMIKRNIFPILCLIVSGGHTQLILMENHLKYKIVGQTLDDAAGEAFDKVARILGLGYPGGPVISSTAEKFKVRRSRLPEPGTGGQSKFKVALPRPMINSNDFNFSFSGLKTAVLYEVKKNKRLLGNKRFVSFICQEFQQAVVDVLISKTIAAAKKFKPHTMMIAGGVSANKALRYQLKKAIKNHFSTISYAEPPVKYSVDNAVMIAIAGYYRSKRNKNKLASIVDNWKKIQPDANLNLK